MTKYESEIKTINAAEAHVYDTLSDFRNISQLKAFSEVGDVVVNGSSCTFTMKGAGKASLNIIEKKPTSLIKVEGTGKGLDTFFIWIQLKQVNVGETKMRITLGVNVNVMLKMVLKKHLSGFVDTLANQLTDTFNRKSFRYN